MGLAKYLPQTKSRTTNTRNKADRHLIAVPRFRPPMLRCTKRGHLPPRVALMRSRGEGETSYRVKIDSS